MQMRSIFDPSQNKSKKTIKIEFHSVQEIVYILPFSLFNPFRRWLIHFAVCIVKSHTNRSFAYIRNDTEETKLPKTVR